MAVQHQQRAMFNQQQYSSMPYNQNSTRPYYQQTENDSVRQRKMKSFYDFFAFVFLKKGILLSTNEFVSIEY